MTTEAVDQLPAEGTDHDEANVLGWSDGVERRGEADRRSWGPDRRAEVRREAREAMLRLVVGVVAVLSIAAATDTLIWVAMVAFFAFFIVLHEFGHFIMARRAGMKVTEFFVGFGPRIWSIRRGETEYGLKALPLGGYVKIIGMNNLESVAPSDEHRAYRNGRYRDRFAVAIAGSTMHFLSAIVLFVVLFGVIGDFRNEPVVRLTSLVELEQTPAQAVGLRDGDKIVKVNGTTVSTWRDLVDQIQARPGETVALEVMRAEQRIVLRPTLAQIPITDPVTGLATGKQRGVLGVREPLVKDDFPTAVGRSVMTTARIVPQTLAGIANVFRPSSIERQAGQVRTAAGGGDIPVDQRPISAVGITQAAVSGARTDNGIYFVVSLFAQVNMFIGVFNLMPLPPLDGGLLAVASYERLRSRRGRRHHVDMNRLLPVAYAVIAVLLVFGLSTVFLDIASPISVR